MIIYAPGASSAMPAEMQVSAIHRSDLTPIPQTIELVLRDHPSTASIKQGAVVKATRAQAEFVIVKETPGGASGNVQGGQQFSTRYMIGLLASCAPVANPLQRSVIRYGASLGAIYRACGAQVRIDQDFSVSAFACLQGDTPTYGIAQALQEEAGVLVVQDTKVAFRRLAELMAQDPVKTIRDDSAQGVESVLLQRQSLPYAISTGTDGSMMSVRSESGAKAVYRPRADPRILKNLNSALLLARKVDSDYAPYITAGMRFDIAGKPYVVITAAHADSGGADGGAGVQRTKLWLGQLST